MEQKIDQRRWKLRYFRDVRQVDLKMIQVIV